MEAAGATETVAVTPDVGGTKTEGGGPDVRDPGEDGRHTIGEARTDL